MSAVGCLMHGLLSVHCKGLVHLMHGQQCALPVSFDLLIIIISLKTAIFFDVNAKCLKNALIGE